MLVLVVNLLFPRNQRELQLLKGSVELLHIGIIEMDKLFVAYIHV
jgi:hypothetical protein